MQQLDSLFDKWKQDIYQDEFLKGRPFIKDGIMDDIIYSEQNVKVLFISNESNIDGYFDLNTDYNAIKKEISELCPALKDAAESISGIRILRQEPWEALCSFIISQNNNIPRIKGIVSRLCEGFGEKKDGCYSFPSAETLSRLSVEELAPLRAGFRARYILDAAKKVADGEVALDAMYELPLEECRKELMKIVGVGAKVAECTLLYGLHRLEAFPVDVWMKKALADSFSGVTAEGLGRYAGIAQQYIFHYTRNISE